MIIEKPARAIIDMETIDGIAFDGTMSTSNAPKSEPASVRTISSGKRRRSIAFLPIKGKVPPTLMKVKASILVARAVRGSMPN